MGDKFFKESCCHPSVMIADMEYCDRFTARRPTDNGSNYDEPDLGKPFQTCRMIVYTNNY